MGEKRKTFTYSNRYQKQIVLLAFGPVLIIYAVVATLLALMRRDLLATMVYTSSDAVTQLINSWLGLIHSSVFMVLILILMWVFTVSGNLVGAVDRILRALDHIIEGKGKQKIKAREKDDLMNEILDRINAIIQRLP